MRYFNPTQEQTLLLKSCLSNDSNAIEFFEQWARTTKINFDKAIASPLGLPQVYDQLDFGSQRLLSLLHYNLTQQGCDHQIIDKLKGYFKYIWLKNQVLQNELHQIANKFSSAEIEMIAFKGISLSKNYYPHFGTRPSIDLDVVIQPNQMESINTVLLDMGWKPKFEHQRISRLNDFLAHAITLKRDKQELDLHQRFSQFHLKTETYQNIWKSSNKDAIGIRYLAPAHELFCVILHGMKWSQSLNLRWVTDAVYVIKTFKDSDWEEFINTVSNENYHDLMGQSLQYLQDEGFISIPSKHVSLIQGLNMDQHSSVDKLTRLLTSKRDPNDYTQFKINYQTAKLASETPTGKWKSLLTHYKMYWGLRSNFQVLKYVLEKVIGKLLNRNRQAQPVQTA